MQPDKPVHADNVPTNANRQRDQVPHEEIVRRAEQIWRERGQPAGQDDAIWLEAENQLKARAESRPVAGTESRPYVDEPGQQTRTRTKTQDPAESAVQTRSATEGRKPVKTPRLRNQ